MAPRRSSCWMSSSATALTPIQPARSSRPSRARSRRRPGESALSPSSRPSAARQPIRRAWSARRRSSRRPGCSWLPATPRPRGWRHLSSASAGPREGRAEPMPAPKPKIPPTSTPLFEGGIRALNVGVAEFAVAPRAHGATVLELDWRPPARGDRDLGLLLARLEDDPDDPIGSRVAAANARAIERILAARPMLVDIGPAGDNVKGLGPRHLLHAGPPIACARMCGPMRGAIIGAILYEGWADTPDAAERLAAGGGVTFAPCHHFGAVGPMAGIVSPSMPVFVVDNAPGGTRAFAILNDGMGKVLRFGAYSQEVLDRLRWMNESLAPALSRA